MLLSVAARAIMLQTLLKKGERSMKRTALAAICLLAILALLGCSGKDTYIIPAPTGPVTEPTQPTTVPPTTVPPTTVPPTTEPEPDPGITEITLTFVGDCTLGRNHLHMYEDSFDAVYAENGPDYFLEKVRHVFEADDLTVVNLEGPLTTSGNIQTTRQYCHKGAPEYVSVLTGASVEVASLGNNHLEDYGQSGVNQTLQVLEDAGIGYSYYNKAYLVKEVKGIKVGFVSLDDVRYSYKSKEWAQKGYTYLREEQNCALVIASMHWGGDKYTQQTPQQVALGHALVDMGYDLVVGHHSHVLQAIEIYKGTPICYSLGNFCYGGSKNPKDMDSGIFQRTFTFHEGQLVEDSNFQFIPCRFSGDPVKNNYQPYVAEGEEAARIIEKMNGYSAKYGFRLDADGRPVISQ